MNFASFQFWLILATCFVISRILILITVRLKPEHADLVARLSLLATALTLLSAESWLTLATFAWVIGFGWIAVVTTRTKRGQSLILFVSLLLVQLAPLIYFKYWNFLFNEVLGLGWGRPSVLIPMGLSFYTFQTLSFWIDTRKSGAAVPSLLNFLNYCSFFPQIVAGPIERREELLPQITENRFRLSKEAVDAAVRWIVLGLAYKMVVADNLGNLSGLLRINPENAWHVWFECFVFGLRIYFDFAGYSFIAVGLGLLFGVKLTLNFRSPYWSSDLREFWRRWHVSLGAWLRDYIYIPLGGRNRFWILNTLIVFVVSGIWHGAGWGFLIWGFLHGAGVVFSGLGRRWPLPSFMKRAFTFTFSIGVWLFFFERDGKAMFTKVMAMCNPLAYTPNFLKQLPAVFASPSDAVTVALVIAIALGALIIEGLDALSQKTQPYRLLRRIPSILVCVALIVWLAPTEESSFIYFNF